MPPRPARALIAMVLAAALTAGPLAAQEQGEGHGSRENPRGHGPLRGPGWADPSDVLAAEIAFARAAQDKGQWTAFRQTAARDAQMFAGSPISAPVRVAAYLKGRADPAVPLKWQPHAAWMACDGSYAVTRGAWQSGKSNGWFITVWQRQEKGGYKWVLDQGDDLKSPLEAPEFLTAEVADCPPRAHGDDGNNDRHHPDKPKPAKDAPPPEYLAGKSDDGTLTWITTLAPSGARHFTLHLRHDGVMREVTSADSAPAG